MGRYRVQRGGLIGVSMQVGFVGSVSGVLYRKLWHRSGPDLVWRFGKLFY